MTRTYFVYDCGCTDAQCIEPWGELIRWRITCKGIYCLAPNPDPDVYVQYGNEKDLIMAEGNAICHLCPKGSWDNYSLLERRRVGGMQACHALVCIIDMSIIQGFLPDANYDNIREVFDWLAINNWTLLCEICDKIGW